MGEIANIATTTAATNTLNWMFNDNIQATYKRIESLRNADPLLSNLLNPDFGSGSKPYRRRQTLRYAAMLLMDEAIFDATYPSVKFQTFLRWLTWLGKGKEDFKITVDGKALKATKAARPILETLQKALPPKTGNYTPVYFTWHPVPPAAYALTIDTRKNPMTVDIYTKDDGGLTADDGEDDV